MAKDDKTGSDGMDAKGVSRRDFLRYSGTATAVLAMPQFLAACGVSPEMLDEHTRQLDLSGLAVNVTRHGYRREDMLYLKFGFVNMKVAGTPAALVKDQPGRPSLIVVTFPNPQHILEQCVAEGGTPPPNNTVLRAMASDESRLVFVVPSTVASIAQNVESILSVCTQAGLNVSRGAQGWTVDANAPGTVSGPGTDADPPRWRAPAALETALELPTRLVISPNQYGRFAHATRPVGDGQRFELWHTRLGTSRRGGQRIDEITPTRRKVRAVYTRTMPESGTIAEPVVPATLSSDHRWEIVRASTNFGTAAAKKNPAPASVEKLSLSAFGGTLDSDFVPSTPLPASVILERWKNKTLIGRDQFVEVAEKGYAFPWGHKMTLLTISERRFSNGAGPMAAVFQKHVLVVKQPVKTWAPIPNAASRQNPFKSVRFLTLQSDTVFKRTEFAKMDTDVLDAGDMAFEVAVAPSSLSTPSGRQAFFALDANGKGIQWEMEAVDLQNRTHRFSTAIVWCPDLPTELSLVDYMNVELIRGGGATIPMRNQRFAFVPPKVKAGALAGASEDNAYPTTKMLVAGQKTTTAVPPFSPLMGVAEIQVEAIRALTGSSEPKQFKYASMYLEHGFEETLEGQNPREIFFELTGTNPPPIGVNFSNKADKAGGFIAPSIEIGGLSRLTGTVRETAGTAARSINSNPAAAFGGDLAANLPKLFGCIKLTQMLDVDKLEDMTPKFITEAYNDAERLIQTGQRVIDTAVKLREQVDQARVILQQAMDVWNFIDLQVLPEFGRVKQRLVELTEGFERIKGAAANAEIEDLERDIGALLRPDLVLTLNQYLKDPRVVKAGLMVPALDAPIRVAERIVSAVHDFMSGDAMDKVRAAFVAICRGIEMVRDGNVRLEWRPKIKAWSFEGVQLFKPNNNRGLLLSADIRTRSNGPNKAGVDLVATLDDFELTLYVVALQFKRLQFRQRIGKKSEIDVIFGGIGFMGPLAFVERLKNIIPLDGFSDPPNVSISASGLKAGFSIAIPDIAVGMFALQNVSVGAELNVPFLGDALSFGFFFSTRDNPFVVQVAFYGGGGFLGFSLNPMGIVALEAAFEFGARLSLDFGIASGCVEAMGGIYFCYRLQGADKGVTLTGYLRIRGVVDVMGFLTCSMELRLEMEYQGCKVAGSATLEFEVSMGFFSKSFKKTVRRQFAGSNGDPTFAEVMGGGARSNNNVLPAPWMSYCEAFAA